MHFLVRSPLTSLQPCSFSACWSTWHGYLSSSEVGRREGGRGAGLKVMQEAFRRLLVRHHSEFPGVLGSWSLAPRRPQVGDWYPPGSLQLAGSGWGGGCQPWSRKCKYLSILLLFLKVAAATPGSDVRSFSLFALIFCLGSAIMVVNGCHLLISFLEKLFTARVGRSSGPWEVQGAPRQLRWRGSSPESSPVSGCPPPPLVSLLDVQPC